MTRRFYFTAGQSVMVLILIALIAAITATTFDLRYLHKKQADTVKILPSALYPDVSPAAKMPRYHLLISRIEYRVSSDDASSAYLAFQVQFQNLSGLKIAFMQYPALADVEMKDGAGNVVQDDTTTTHCLALPSSKNMVTVPAHSQKTFTLYSPHFTKYDRGIYTGKIRLKTGYPVYATKVIRKSLRASRADLLSEPLESDATCFIVW